MDEHEGKPSLPLPPNAPEPLRRLGRRIADLERQRALREEHKEREKALKEEAREQERAEREAAKEKERAERRAEQIADAEERYAREEEKALAREERRRERRERTVHRSAERVTFASTLRQMLWRVVMSPLGGVRVVGTFPEGPVVMVPNHTSHVDTAAMMAGVPTVMRVIPVAAADYWFRSPTRAWIARRAIGAFPVDRGGHGAYNNLRELLRPRVEDSCSVLIFAEGTRSPDGQVQKFKKGPALLARDFDVPLLPVAIVGAYEAWPKGGKPSYSPVELRVGQPVPPSDDIEDMTAQARAQIIELKDRGPVEPPVSALWNATHRFLGDKRSTWLFFATGLGNTVIWPVPAESVIALFAVARRDRLWHNIAAVSAGSLLGVATAYLLAAQGVRAPRWLTTRGSREVVDRLVGRGGVRQVFWRTIEDAPDINVAEAAADHRLPAGQVLLAVGAGDLVRSAVVVGAAAAFAKPVGKYVRQRYGTYLFATGTAVAGWVGYRAARWWWRRR